MYTSYAELCEFLLRLREKTKFVTHCKVLIIIFFLIFSSSCSNLERLVFSPSINQGKYPSSKDISKISLGMTQQQVTRVLGTPIIIDPFNTNNWFYIFYQLSGHRIVMKKILSLNFNNLGILISIDSNSTQKNSSILNQL